MNHTMNQNELQQLYSVMFTDYPDVVSIPQLCKMLGGISVKTAYKLIQNGQIPAFIIGRAYRIPKLGVVQFLNAPKNPFVKLS